jgi:hypothetical protein
MSYIHHAPMKERILSVRVDSEMEGAMLQLQERYGTPLSEQVRRALKVWLVEQGVLKTERPRAATRKRS